MKAHRRNKRPGTRKKLAENVEPKLTELAMKSKICGPKNEGVVDELENLVSETDGVEDELETGESKFDGVEEEFEKFES